MRTSYREKYIKRESKGKSMCNAKRLHLVLPIFVFNPSSPLSRNYIRDNFIESNYINISSFYISRKRKKKKKKILSSQT